MRIKKVHLYTVGGLVTLVTAITIAIPLVLAQPPPPPCGECYDVQDKDDHWEVFCEVMEECTCHFWAEPSDEHWDLVSHSEGEACQAACQACLVPSAGLTKAPPAAIWLADVCEPDDGFSENGEMTLDTNLGGPLEVAASMEGPWYAVEVNGPPWVVTEENLASFAAMVGVDDWHDLWVRANECYPQHLGNLIATRDARMDELCE